ncbi:hypothetical protein Tco_0787030 [Tanacetum coccineum]
MGHISVAKEISEIACVFDLTKPLTDSGLRRFRYMKKWSLKSAEVMKLKVIGSGVTNMKQMDVILEYFVLKREDNNKITAAHLPYFDGAFWLGAVESMSKKLEEEEGLGKLWIKSPNKPTLKALGQDNPPKDVLVMQQVMDEEDTIYKLDKALHEPSRFIIPCYTIVGIIHVGRDMYDRVPQGNVGDDQGSNLLKNCYNALPDGKVILIEAILPFLSVISSATKVVLDSLDLTRNV